MDSKDQQPGVNDPKVIQPPIMPAIHEPTTTDQAGSAKREVSDAEAQALLTIHNVQASQRPKSKLSMGMLLTIATLIILVVLASFVLGSFKSGSSSKSSSSTNSSSSTQPSPSSSDKTSNQINQDVNSCSNPVNAVSEC